MAPCSGDSPRPWRLQLTVLTTVLRLDSHPSVEVSYLEVEVEVDLAVEVDDISAAAESSG